MKTRRVALLSLTMIATVSLSVSAADSRRAPAARQANPQAVEAQIVRQLDSLQGQLKQQELLMQRRMAQATKLREQGLQRNDQKLLQQAEQIERQALAEYVQHVQRFERTGAAAAAAVSQQSKAQAGIREPATRQPSQRQRQPQMQRQPQVRPAPRQQPRSAQASQSPREDAPPKNLLERLLRIGA